MKVDAVFEEMATRAMFGRLKASELPPAGYAYRKGNTFEDVKKAFHAGLHEGAGKTERELDAIAHRFSHVFKKEVKA